MERKKLQVQLKNHKIMNRIDIILIILVMLFVNSCFKTKKNEKTVSESIYAENEISKKNSVEMDSSSRIIYHLPDSIIKILNRKLKSDNNPGKLICNIVSQKASLHFDFMKVDNDSFEEFYRLSEKTNRFIKVDNKYIPLIFDTDQSFSSNRVIIFYSGTECTVEFFYADNSFLVY